MGNSRKLLQKIYENVYYAMVEAGVALKSEWWTQVLVGQHSIC
jgi:hypothetical protein